MLDCPHISQSVIIAGVDLSRLQNKREGCEDSGRSSRMLTRKHSYSGEAEKVQWNCVVCDSTDSPWLCLCCGLIFCGRYVKGHGLSHASEKQSHDSRHCVSMQCNSGELFCYSCDSFVEGDTSDGRVHSVRKSLIFLNKSRCLDHSYAARQRSGSYSSEDGIDLGTEEEDEIIPQPASGRFYNQDEDSGSVPEEEALPNFQHNHLPGALVGGRLLRPRKRKQINNEDHFMSIKISKNCMQELKPRGLRNLGNTCFMNAVVQALCVTDIFREYLTRLPMLEPDDDIIEDSSLPIASPRYNTRRAASYINNGINDDMKQSSSFLAEEFRKVLIALTDIFAASALSPDEFLQAVWKISPRFRGFQQQDAHEFLRCALDRLHCELKRCRIPESVDKWLEYACGGGEQLPSTTAVSRIFEGSLQSQVVCLTCHTASNKHESFMDLSLDIYETSGQIGNIQLADCIRRFFDKEELGQCEQYMCGHCMDKRPSTKQLMLRVLPTVLCLHLKRFRWTDINKGKLDNMVDFPLSGLDISPFMATSTRSSHTSPLTFDLTSVVVHHGSGATSGHYTTFGRRNGSWYHFNDSTVKACSEQTVLKQKAYLLFYTRSPLSRAL